MHSTDPSATGQGGSKNNFAVALGEIYATVKGFILPIFLRMKQLTYSSHRMVILKVIPYQSGRFHLHGGCAT